MTDTSLTEELISLTESKPITEDDLEQAALYTLDAVANALAGRNSKPGQIVLRWAQGASSDAGRKAFVMGALTHILETDDLHRASVVHPGCVVVPAAWAVAERENAGGHAMLVAVLRGFEAVCRIGAAVGPAHYYYWHNTATCGPFGSAMAAASLLGLDTRAAVNALGNAGTQSAGLWQFLETGAMSKHLHAGRGAESGVLAADLAARGFTGPARILEGDKGFFAAACPDASPDAVMSDREAQWKLRETSIKPWPSCRHTHPTIDAAQELRADVEPKNIQRIIVRTYQAAVDICDRPDPQTEYDAKFSLQHCAAAALCRNGIDFSAFDAVARAESASLRGRVEIRVEEPYASRYPLAWGGAVEVVMSDGSTVSAQRTHAKGDPEAALGRDELIGKARRLMEFGGVEQPRRLIDAVLSMPTGGPIPDLDSHLMGASSSSQ